MKLEKVTVSIRWTARIWSIVSLGFVLLIVVGEFLYPHAPPPATFRDWAGLLLFPFGTCLGLILAWRWEGFGGGIAVGSLPGFYMVLWIVDRQLPRGPFFALVAAPGLLFQGAWMITRLNN